MELSLLAIDLAKDVFELHGRDLAGRVTLKRRIRRSQLTPFIAQLSPCRIGMEACGGAHFWAREFRKMGHSVQLIAPQFVKPFRKSNKNDAEDAAAIAEAMERPEMRFVPIKETWQQDIQSLHRVRSRLVRERTALGNEVRGLIAEYGIVLPRGWTAFRKQVSEILATSEEQSLSPIMLRLIESFLCELSGIEERIERIEEELHRVVEQYPSVKRLREIPGVGLLTATCLYAAVGNGSNFKNGRQMAAFFGLVPRQNSSGGKHQLLGISKRGDPYLRTLLIHGARAVIRYAHNKNDRRSRWAIQKLETRGLHRASVALANKTARIAWVVLTREEKYQVYATAA